MGEANRRKTLDPNWGKATAPPTGWSFSAIKSKDWIDDLIASLKNKGQWQLYKNAELAGIIEKLLQREFPSVSIGDKLLLTLPDAQALTGLSREILREAIASGELKAKVIGKGWRIKRSDLDEFIDELY